MKFTAVIGTFFYSVTFFLLGIIIIAFVLHLVFLEDIVFALTGIYNDANLRIIWGAVGAMLILLNVSFFQMMVGRFHKEKNIAFMNPTGEVTISLSAIEGLIKRLTADISEIKELKPDVFANKKGINIFLKVVLWSEINIPEITSRLQELIKTKIQEMLGIEETINVKVHVIKIIAPEAGKARRERGIESEPTIPFKGYR